MSEEGNTSDSLRRLEQRVEEFERKTTPTGLTFIMRAIGIITGFSLVAVPACIIKRWDIVKLCIFGGVGGILHAIYLQMKNPHRQLEELKPQLKHLISNLKQGTQLREDGSSHLNRLVTAADLNVQNACMRLEVRGSDSRIKEELTDAKLFLQEALQQLN